jgi:Mannosyltransferase (PIG-V)
LIGVQKIKNLIKRFTTWFQALAPTRQDILASIAVGLSLIIMSVGLGYFNNRTVSSYPEPGYHYINEPNNKLSFMASWDAPDYLAIAQSGYTNNFWINWFPGYPLVINAVNRVIPSALDSALAISWVSLIGAIYFYLKVVREIIPKSNGTEGMRAWPLWLLFPTGIFLVAPFTESLTALLGLAGIYMALKKHWLAAGLIGLLCSATHITGIFAVVLMGLILEEEGLDLKRSFGTIVIGSLGLLAYMGFLWKMFNNPLGFIWSQQVFHHWTDGGLLGGYDRIFTTPDLMNVVSAALVIGAIWYWWKRRRSFAIYSVLFLAIVIVGKQYGGFDRYILLDFSIPLMLYELLRDRRTQFPLVMSLFGISWAYFALQYMGGYTGS